MRMKQADAENEKFSFRIWLLGLGMKGEEYKTARRILLAPLKGNTAFRRKRKGNRKGEDHEKSTAWQEPDG